MRKTALSLVVTFLAIAGRAAAAQDVVRCEADFSALMEGRGTMVLAVRIAQSPGGKLQSVVNDKMMNADVDVRDYEIRDGLDLGAIRGGADDLNQAESALQHLGFLTSDPATRGTIELSFALEDVKRMRIYDVEPGSEADKFGGTILMEALDAQGRLLGRVFRSIFANGCF